MESLEAGGDKEDPPLEHGPTRPSFQTSGLQNCKRTTFYCFKLLALWEFLTAAYETNTEMYQLVQE
jgi:hypothetical protein